MGRSAITFMTANLLHLLEQASSGMPVMISNIDPYRICFSRALLVSAAEWGLHEPMV